MNHPNSRWSRDSLALVVSGALAIGTAVAQAQDSPQQPRDDSAAAAGMHDRDAMHDNAMHDDDRSAMRYEDYDREEMSEEANEAQEQVDEAVDVVRQMKRDQNLTRLLAQSKGVLIVPDYGKGALVVGARGGEGVLLLHEGGDWNSPAFYNIGGLSIGAQAGGAAGSIAVLLMTDEAVQQFRSDDNVWSLNANAGLTIIDYSADVQATAGKGDVVFWSDTEGLFAGAALGISDIMLDEEANQAYYNGQPTTEEILSSAVTNPNAKPLQEELPAQVASR